jgi:hypothetical protein
MTHGSGVNYSAAVTYTPAANFHSPPDDSFSFTVSDNHGHTSAAATVTITVNSVNDPPVAVADTYSVAEDNVLAPSAGTGVLANDTDPENDPLTAQQVSGPTHAASFTLNGDGSFTYTPAADFNGSDSFSYRDSDGEHGHRHDRDHRRQRRAQLQQGLQPDGRRGRRGAERFGVGHCDQPRPQQ